MTWTVTISPPDDEEMRHRGLSDVSLIFNGCDELHGLVKAEDARVAAAGRDLLEALDAQMHVSMMLMRKLAFDDQDIADSTAQARAAIAKATGVAP